MNRLKTSHNLQHLVDMSEKEEFPRGFVVTVVTILLMFNGTSTLITGSVCFLRNASCEENPTITLTWVILCYIGVIVTLMIHFMLKKKEKLVEQTKESEN